MKYLVRKLNAPKGVARIAASLAIILACAPMPALHAEQSTVHFDNKTLEAAVRSTLKKPSGELTVKDMASLTTLITNWNFITSLKGLEHAVNLKELRVMNSDVSDIGPIAKLSGLETLMLIDNQISDLRPLRQLNNLKTLNLERNRIADLSPLESLTSLEHLDVSTNLISDIQPLQKLVHLDHLDLSDNYIKNVDGLRTMTHLQGLDLLGNLFSDLSPLGQLIGLDSLDISNNNVRELAPLEPLHLNSLKISDTYITDLSPLENMNTLQSVTASQSMSFDPNSQSFLERFKAAGHTMSRYNTSTTPKIFLNGEVQTFFIRSELYDDRVMTPLRSILEWTGAEWSWNGKTRQVTLNYLDKEVILTIDSNTIIENGKSRKIDVSPFIQDDYTMVPIRFVTEAFGLHLEYDAKFRWVKLTTTT